MCVLYKLYPSYHISNLCSHPFRKIRQSRHETSPAEDCGENVQIPSYLKDPLMPPDTPAPVVPRGVSSTQVRKENRYAHKHPRSTSPRGGTNDSGERNFIELKAYLLPVDSGETIDLRTQGHASSTNSVDTYPHYLISNAEQTTFYEPRIHCSCRTIDSAAPPRVSRSCDCLE